MDERSWVIPSRRSTRPAPSALRVVVCVAYAACARDGPTPTEPRATAQSAATGPAAVASLLPRIAGDCLLASRSASGQYRARAVAMAVPSDASDPSGALVEFAYRGWSTGVSDPVRLATCAVPDTPAARAYFAAAFGGTRLAFAEVQQLAIRVGVPGAATWTPRDVPPQLRLSRASYVVDGSVAAAGSPGAAAASTAPLATTTVSTMLVGDPPYCDPSALIPESGCGDVAEDAPDPNDPPAPPAPVDGPSDLLTGAAPVMSVGASFATIPTPWTCFAYGPAPYLIGYGNRGLLGIEVVLRAKCSNGAPYRSISGQLQRQYSYL